MITFKQIEADVLAAFKAAEGYLATDPNAQALAETAKSTLTTAKSEAVAFQADAITSAVADLLTPLLGADEAKAAGLLASQAVVSAEGKFTVASAQSAETV
jgi:hypothetical protein